MPFTQAQCLDPGEELGVQNSPRSKSSGVFSSGHGLSMTGPQGKSAHTTLSYCTRESGQVVAFCILQALFGILFLTGL